MRLLMTDPLLLRSGAAFGGNADAALRAQRTLQYHYRVSLQFLAQQHMLDVPVLNALAVASGGGNGKGSSASAHGVFAGVGQKGVSASPFASLAAVAHDQEPHNFVFAHALSSGWLRSICDRKLVTRHVWVMEGSKCVRRERQVRDPAAQRQLLLALAYTAFVVPLPAVLNLDANNPDSPHLRSQSRILLDQARGQMKTFNGQHQ